MNKNNLPNGMPDTTNNRGLVGEGKTEPVKKSSDILSQAPCWDQDPDISHIQNAAEEASYIKEFYDQYKQVKEKKNLEIPLQEPSWTCGMDATNVVNVDSYLKYKEYVTEQQLSSPEYNLAYLNLLTDIYAFDSMGNKATLCNLYQALNDNFHTSTSIGSCEYNASKRKLSLQDFMHMDLSPKHFNYLVHECFEKTFNPERDITVQDIITEDIPGIVKYLTNNALKILTPCNLIRLTTVALHLDLWHSGILNCSLALSLREYADNLERSQDIDFEQKMFCNYFHILEGSDNDIEESSLRDLLQYIINSSGIRDMIQPYQIIAPIQALLGYRPLYEFEKEGIKTSYPKRIEYCKELLELVVKEQFLFR